MPSFEVCIEPGNVFPGLGGCLNSPPDATTPQAVLGWILGEIANLIERLMGMLIGWRDVGPSIKIPAGFDTSEKCFDLKLPSGLKWKQKTYLGASMRVPSGEFTYLTKNCWFKISGFPTGIKKKSFQMKYPYLKPAALKTLGRL